LPFCPHCGKEIFSTDRFCFNYGQNLGTSAGRQGFVLPSIGISPRLVPNEVHAVLNYCPNCGAPLAVGQNFCKSCGFDIRGRTKAGDAGALPVASAVYGLGRNTLLHLVPEGFLGIKIRSSMVLLLAFLLPIPFLAGIYYVIEAGALAVYFTLWVAASLLLYDEFRWRRLRDFYKHSPSDLTATEESWIVPWHAIRMADWNGRTLWFSSNDPARKLSATFDQKDSSVVESTLTSWGVRYSWRPPRFPPFLARFSTLAILMFVASQAILILAAILPFFPGEAQIYTTILNNTRSQVAGVSFFDEFRAIFLNNIQVAWGGAVPFLGILSSGLASYNTGRVIQAIAIGDQFPSSLVLASLYILPHTWIEESSYPIATVAGILAVTRWRSVAPDQFSRRVNRGSTKFALALGGAALILTIAGLSEVLVSYIGYGAVTLWVPLSVGYYLLMMRNRRHKRQLST
jgi:uncharacterized membrane protein SpoIIM required for sporulation